MENFGQFELTTLNNQFKKIEYLEENRYIVELML